MKVVRLHNPLPSPRSLPHAAPRDARGFGPFDDDFDPFEDDEETDVLLPLELRPRIECGLTQETSA